MTLRNIELAVRRLADYIRDHPQKKERIIQLTNELYDKIMEKMGERK